MSKDADTLKAMREFRQVSLRKMGDLMGVSFSTVAQMEKGRANISSEYKNKFLLVLGYSLQDWKQFSKGENKNEEVRQKCIEILSEIPSGKLEFIYQMLLNLPLSVWVIFCLFYRR
jgi:transcriptional regulator with XRE-family HTH domain